MGDEEHLVLECPHEHVQSIKDIFSGLFMVSTMTRFFWQDDLVNVSKFVYEGMDVLLGAASDDQSLTSHQS